MGCSVPKFSNHNTVFLIYIHSFKAYNSYDLCIFIMRTIFIIGFFVNVNYVIDY